MALRNPPPLSTGFAAIALVFAFFSTGCVDQAQAQATVLREFQPRITVYASAGNSTHVEMAAEDVRDVSRFKFVTVRYRIDKRTLSTANDTTLKLFTAMSSQDDDEWLPIGSGVTLDSATPGSFPSISTEAVDAAASGENQELLRYLRWELDFASDGTDTKDLVQFSIDIVGHP